MNTSAQCWYCSQCGLYLYSEDEASSHHRSTHQPGSAQPRLYGRCGDCEAWLTGIETITHRCDEAEQRRASAGWGPVTAAVVIVAIVAWIVGRMTI